MIVTTQLVVIALIVGVLGIISPRADIASAIFLVTIGSTNDSHIKRKIKK